MEPGHPLDQGVQGNPPQVAQVIIVVIESAGVIDGVLGDGNPKISGLATGILTDRAPGIENVFVGPSFPGGPQCYRATGPRPPALPAQMVGHAQDIGLHG